MTFLGGAWRGAFRPAAGATAAILASSCLVAVGKLVEDRISLTANQSLVVAKFCFDFNPSCSKNCTGAEPGNVSLEVFRGARRGPAADNKTALTELSFALFDDQYNSFPEVAQIWSEAECTDLLRAARRNVRVPWQAVAGATPEKPWRSVIGLAESLRPRYWYLAFVSCSNATLELSYRLHTTNPLQGAEAEFSMDARGVLDFSALFALLFGAIAVVQLRSANAWLQEGAREGTAAAGGVLRLHPAVLLLTAATIFAAAGEAAWLMYYWTYETSGAAQERLAAAGRGGLILARTLLTSLLLLFAHGQCVCAPDMAVGEHKEVLLGVVVFGALCFGLETWSDSVSRNATTEYIYDTRPGMLLIAINLLWLWLYVSRSWRSYHAETRLKPRLFYRMYGAPLTLWFAALPSVALLAQTLDPWVRFRTTFAMDGLVHVVASSALVHSFRPHLAGKLYELVANDYQPVSAEELDKFLQEDDEDI